MFSKTTLYIAFSEILQQNLRWWKSFWVIRITLIFLWWLHFLHSSHTSLLQALFNKSYRIMRQGFSPQLLKSAGTPSWKRTCFFPANCREGMAPLSQLRKMFPPLKLGSVQRALCFRKKRKQNDDLPDPLGPATRHETRCLNLRSSLMQRRAVTRFSLQDLTPISTRNGRTNCHALGASWRRIFYTSVTTSTAPPALLLRLLLRSVCTLTMGSPCSKSWLWLPRDLQIVWRDNLE